MAVSEINLYPDTSLLLLIADDDTRAFDIIYQRYWEKLYLSAYNLLRDREVCEDIVQEVLLQIWIRRGNQQIENLNSYLYTSTRYKVYKAIKENKTFQPILDEMEQICFEDVEVKLHKKDIFELLEQRICLLPQKCREIFILSRKKDLSNKEIASLLGISIKTVENQLTIALRRIRPSFRKILLIISSFFLY